MALVKKALHLTAFDRLRVGRYIAGYANWWFEIPIPTQFDDAAVGLHR